MRNVLKSGTAVLSQTAVALSRININLTAPKSFRDAQSSKDSDMTKEQVLLDCLQREIESYSARRNETIAYLWPVQVVGNMLNRYNNRLYELKRLRYLWIYRMTQDLH